MGPNTAFCLVIFGVLGIYCELIWPGRIWQGVLGAAGAATGSYFLWQAAPTAKGLGLVVLAVVLFATDALIETLYVAGTMATTALAWGFASLLADPNGIRPLLSIPWCVVFGIITMALNQTARRARRNKQV
jgi:membrane-bound serine protease (ClpP class)